MDGFSFCVFDLNLQEFIAFFSYKFDDKNKNTNTLLKNIKTIFIEEKSLSVHFEKVIVTHVNNLSTFVPKALFSEDNIANYIKFNNQIFESDYFVYDDVVIKKWYQFMYLMLT